MEVTRERQRGRHGGGWDALRTTRIARQIADGLFPEGTVLPERNSEPGFDVGPWGRLPPAQQARYARYMEACAAMVENLDHNLGRLTDTLRALGELDDTIVVFTSDNGGTTYTPGERAPYAPEVVARALGEAAAAFE
ncbi:sulfatase-like hydrolase/transferase [Streptomyces sp. NPDC002467]|uniref:sulfatase-like hydrolase/transferase n=1 Tax=Streptomyces sp. NPDC002467 TaxID=3364647 RepID=UPI0036A032E1